MLAVIEPNIALRDDTDIYLAKIRFGLCGGIVNIRQLDK